MARRKTIPKYGTVTMNGIEYYRTRILDADGKRVALYGKTPEELYDKVEEAKKQIEDCTFRREMPTVKEYCEKWLLMQSAHVRNTTMVDYTSKVKNYIIKPLGHMHMVDVTADDIRLAVLPAAKKSESVYRSVNMLIKCIFNSAEDSHIIDDNPTKRLSAKGGTPQKEKEALSDEQVEQLLDAIKGLPPYVFVMIGLYAGLRREEILGLKWDCVHLDEEAPYLSVRRAWHVEHNRPVILTELKTKAAKRSAFIKGYINDFPDADIEFSNINYNTLLKIKEYLEHYENSEPKKIAMPLPNNNFKECVDDWDYNFIDLKNEDIFEIMNAANFMAIQPLLDLSCAKIASLIKGKNEKEIRNLFNMKDDNKDNEDEISTQEDEDDME